MHVYLDHNSTTPVLPEVVEHMAECYAAGYGNAASQHDPGRRARRIVESAREAIGTVLGANLSGRRADRLIFTSGGTEANNLALFGLAGDRRGKLFASGIEHPSVAEPANVLARRGWELRPLGVDGRGVVALDELKFDGLSPAVATLMLGNNETGVLQPVAEAARICRASGVLLHTDAVQVVGKLPIDFGKLDAATMAFSAHKFHGPRGIGALLVRGDVDLSPLLYGGFQQAGLRPGTEPVALVAGMKRALEIWEREFVARENRMTTLRDRFESALQTRLAGVVINGAQAPRLPHTSNVSFRGLDRRAMAMALDLEGVACSTGSACASGSSEPSPVLLAMGLPEEVVEGSLRFSLGATTSDDEIDLAVERVIRVVSRLRQAAGLERAQFNVA
jgi:cysteine desulfurase